MDTTGQPHGEVAEGTPDMAVAPDSERTSALLRHFLDTETNERVSVGALRDALGDRGFGVLLFLFALPNLTPYSIPMISAVLGLPLVILGAQLTYGRHEPWLPDWINRRSFPREGFVAVVRRALPTIERVERLLRPRMTWLFTWTGERLLGAAILLLALILTLPIPFANGLPALGIAVFGLALIEKDGVAVLVGVVVGFLSILVAGAVVIGFIKAGLLLLSTIGG